MPSTIQSLNCPFSTWNCAHKNSQIWNNKACEMWKTVFGYKMNSVLLTDAPLQSIKLIQACVSYLHIFQRITPRPTTHNFFNKHETYHSENVPEAQMSRVCDIHTTPLRKTSDVRLCTFTWRTWINIRFVRFEVRFTVILHLYSNLIYWSVTYFEFSGKCVTVIVCNIKWNEKPSNNVESTKSLQYHILSTEKILFLWITEITFVILYNIIITHVLWKGYHGVSLLNNFEEKKKEEKAKQAHLKYLNDMNKIVNKVVFGQSFPYFSIFTRYLQM